jgi:hypothetical protein
VDILCSTSDTRHVTHFFLKLVIIHSHESGRKDMIVTTTSGTNSRLFVTQTIHSGKSSHDGDRKSLEMMTQLYLKNIPVI